MKYRTKYILLIIFILAFTLTIYNDYNELTETSFDSTELKYAKRFLGIGILCFGIYFFNKNWRMLLIKIMFGIFGITLALNLYIFPGIYANAQANELYAVYSEIETCVGMEKRFVKDLQNKEIKYFYFGIGYDVELHQILENKYNIEMFGMGCMIQSKFECYNKLVYEYLKESHNKSINDIYREIDNE